MIFFSKIWYFAVKSLKPNNPIDFNAGKHNQPPDMTRWMEEWLPALAHFTFQWNHNVLLSNWNSTWHTKCISIWLLQFFLNHSQYDIFFILSRKGLHNIIRGYVFYYKCFFFLIFAVDTVYTLTFSLVCYKNLKFSNLQCC